MANGIDDDDSINSNDETLCEILGLPSLSIGLEIDNDAPETLNVPQSLADLLRVTDEDIDEMAHRCGLKQQFESQSYCIFPHDFAIPPNIMRRLTDELTWGGDKVKADRSYETIKVLKDGEVLERRTLTRFENFVNYHDDWNALCRDYLARLVSVSLQEPYVLFKEKLNLKPPGGSGFAPHLDGPSLRIALGDNGPRTFLTVMVAIDDMTVENGCLRLVKGSWNEMNACSTVEPEQDGNPDAGGRAGAIPLAIAETMDFEDLIVPAGSLVVFSAWMPHRSSANRSPFPRRAVFLTYNPQAEGDHHDQYYQTMQRRRDEWRQRLGLTDSSINSDEKSELDALKTIPKI